MKIQLFSLSALALSFAAKAQEVNPFENPQPAALPASGAKVAVKSNRLSSHSLVEHIVAPADLVDRWIAENPNDQGAGLRAEASKWIEAGAANLDHAAISYGVAGEDIVNRSTREQIYGTEYLEPAEGEWAFPTAFESRNVGYEQNGKLVTEPGPPLFEMEPSLCRIVSTGQILPDPVALRTRQAGDVFLPQFQVIRMTRAEHAPEPANEDPFAGDTARTKKMQAPRFETGVVRLIHRSEETPPSPAIVGSTVGAGFTPPNEPIVEDRKVRLIFFRSEVHPATEPDRKSTGNFGVAVRMVEIDQAFVSRALQGSLAEAAARIADLPPECSPRLVAQLAGMGYAGAVDSLSDVREFIYPTEWKRAEGPGRRLPPTPTAFENRNTGVDIEFEMKGDQILKFAANRVILGGFSIHHRTERNGKWEPDVMFPVFSTNSWISSIAVERGKWVLVGSGSAYDDKGGFLPSRTVVALLKVN